MAMICGCSMRISSATERGSIHLSASSPLLDGPRLMRSMMLAAFSSPSASTSTLRRNSSAPTPTDVWFSTTSEKSASTSCTCSRVTPVRRAIAVPTRWTSLAPMCFKTCAASDSPRVRRRIAARSVPESSCVRSLIVRDPPTHDLRHALRILADERARLSELLLVGQCLHPAGRRHLLRDGALARCSGGGFDELRLRLHHRHSRMAQQCPDQRPQHRQNDDEQDDETDHELRDVMDERLLPQRKLLQLARRGGRLFHERSIHDVHAVPALGIEADRILHELGDVLELLGRERCFDHL